MEDLNAQWLAQNEMILCGMSLSTEPSSVPPGSWVGPGLLSRGSLERGLGTRAQGGEGEGHRAHGDNRPTQAPQDLKDFHNHPQGEMMFVRTSFYYSLIP